MPKIQIIDKCFSCCYFDRNYNECLHDGPHSGDDLDNPNEIPEWCPLEDAKEITGIPCSHVAPEGVCERCGEEVKDG